jgi:hypothetical protein
MGDLGARGCHICGCPVGGGRMHITRGHKRLEALIDAQRVIHECLLHLRPSSVDSAALPGMYDIRDEGERRVAVCAGEQQRQDRCALQARSVCSSTYSANAEPRLCGLVSALCTQLRDPEFLRCCMLGAEPLHFAGQWLSVLHALALCGHSCGLSEGPAVSNDLLLLRTGSVTRRSTHECIVLTGRSTDRQRQVSYVFACHVWRTSLMGLCAEGTQ